MAKRIHQPIDLDHLLHNRQFSHFKESIQQRRQLQLQTQQILSKFHIQNCQLVELSHGKALIATPSAAWLTRLQQLKSVLLSEFRQTYPGLITLEFKINPKLASIKPEPVPKIINDRKISPQSAEYINQVAEHMPAELSEKMKRIAALCGEKRK
ncbi:hypothetical protein [Celerinatantimonas sp. YJH-8]|uniref:hypothetical protein n=1 Tax=Celerinatantimonas sp. YJH-8 TaxID=3228714 RepID=UPI0038BFF9F0